MRTLLGLLLWIALPAAADVTVIGHADMQLLDLKTLQRIYTGKVVELNGTRVTAVNLSAGDPLRERFLSRYLDQDEDEYIGYWVVRRYIGKGTPPIELKSADEVMRFVVEHRGAIGYVDSPDLPPDIKVLVPPAH